MSTRPVLSTTTPLTPIIDPNGQMSFAWIKWFQNVQNVINSSLDQNGNIVGNIDSGAGITGRSGTIGQILGNIDDGGVVTEDGIDFSRIYINQNINFIADGVGSPIAGGKAAFAAFIASDPTIGEMLVYNGTDWLPVPAPESLAEVTHEWLDSYDSTTGLFTQSQPAFADVSGVLSPSQIPPPTTISLGGVEAIVPVAHTWINQIDTAGVPHLSQPAFTDILGVLTAAQLPANVPVVSFGTGAPSGSSTEGYIYFDTTGSPYHGYVFHSGAWEIFS